MKRIDKTVVMGTIIYKMIITKTYNMPMKSVNCILKDVQIYLKSKGYTFSNDLDYQKISSLSCVKVDLNLNGITITFKQSIEGIVIPAITETIKTFFGNVDLPIISGVCDIVLSEIKQ